MNARHILALVILVAGILVLGEYVRADEVTWNEKTETVYRVPAPVEFTLPELMKFLEAFNSSWEIMANPYTGIKHPVMCIIEGEPTTCAWMPQDLLQKFIGQFKHASL